MDILLLILGFVLLIKGADVMVEGAVQIAHRYGISNLVIGMTVVAFGTSAPELVVNLLASFQGKSDLAVGNILGSNVANILLVPGVAALIYPLVIRKKTMKKELPFSSFAVILLILLAQNAGELNRTAGSVLIAFFAFFIWKSFSGDQAEVSAELDEELGEIKDAPLWKSSLEVVGGLIGLGLGGHLIVESAVSISRALGLSEALIGLTIVAIGTSLPEVAASAVAAWKKNPDLAMGNALGSNIFNALWVLGVSSLIRPLSFGQRAVMDAWLVVGATLVVAVLLVLPEKYNLKRKRGLFMLISYGAYIWFLVWREQQGV